MLGNNQKNYYAELLILWYDNYVKLPVNQVQHGREIHAMLCAVKSVTGFVSRDCIQECREACGGHGYLAGKHNLFNVFITHYTVDCLQCLV